jgi:hypothetical protein
MAARAAQNNTLEETEIKKNKQAERQQCMEGNI